MKCPTCVAEGKKSTVSVGIGMTTCAYYTPFYDEDGKYHYHDGNITTTELSCSNGHTWAQRSGNSCWCGWTNEVP
jgi:hypothetical protein